MYLLLIDSQVRQAKVFFECCQSERSCMMSITCSAIANTCTCIAEFVFAGYAEFAV